MLNKKLVKIMVLFIAPAILMVVKIHLTHAAEETKKHSEKGLPPEHQTANLPVCPLCKKVRLTPEKEKTLAAKGTVCPDCKSEVSELAVHHCVKCGKDVPVCVLCQKAPVSLKGETMIGKCPRCKQVLSRYVKGKVTAKKKMKCRDCKMKSQVWLVQHCKKCNIDFLACPFCEKEQEKFQ